MANDNREDGISRRQTLECIMWVGIAILWITSGNAPPSLSPLGQAQAAVAIAQTKPTIPVIVKDTTSPYWRTVLAGARKAGQDFGVEFYGSKATLVTTGSGWTVYEGTGKNEKVAERHEPAEQGRAHMANFLDCIASREKPNADIEIGHKSTLLCHLANIAWRTRSPLTFDGRREAIVGNEAASQLMGRTYRPGFELPAIG